MTKIKIETAHEEVNLADKLDTQHLNTIGRELHEAIEADDRTRESWISDQGEYLKLAAQVRESKGFPWQDASNVKYPLLTLAAVHFHARAMPGLINGERPVLAKVNGRATPEKEMRASRVSTFMSYQVNSLNSEWMDVMDRLLFVLPIVGLAYKKTIYCDVLGRDKSELVLPSELILNYYATDYNRARMTHVRYMDANEFIEHVRLGFFLDRDLDVIDGGKGIEDGERDTTIGLTPPQEGTDEAYRLYESHAYLDLDGDGYKEPYIVTLDSKSMKVVRIVARWKPEDITYNEKGDVGRIVPMNYFTQYQLLPDPNSAVYALGFGHLLGSTNETVNTIINQLIDAGTLSNLQSGFIGRGVKLPGGATRFKPGEWKLVNSTGDDIRKAVFPMPVREPSQALLSLLQLLLDAGQQVTSVSDMMMGENPGQNQKATTTMAVLEQGLSVFKGIYRRLHRSLTRELKVMAELNFLYLDEDTYHGVLDDSLPAAIPSGSEEAGESGMLEQSPDQGSVVEDFDLSDMDITPTSDPSIITDAQRLAKSQSLIEKMSMGMPINKTIVTKRVLEAEQQENVPELMTLPPPAPSLEEKEFELETLKTRIELYKAYHQAVLQIAQAEAAEEGTQISLYSSIAKDMMGVIGLQNDQEDRAAKKAEAAAAASKGAPSP